MIITVADCLQIMYLKLSIISIIKSFVFKLMLLNSFLNSKDIVFGNYLGIINFSFYYCFDLMKNNYSLA